jgi:hypothetical protein
VVCLVNTYLATVDVKAVVNVLTFTIVVIKVIVEVTVVVVVLTVVVVDGGLTVNIGAILVTPTPVTDGTEP